MAFPDISIHPNARSALAFGWHAMKERFLLLFLVVIILILVDLPLDRSDKMTDESFLGGLLLLAYVTLFAPVINYAADAIFLRTVRGDDDVVMSDILDGFRNYINVVLAALLVFGLVGISFVFLVVPGIYVGCRLAFVSYIVMDEGLDPIEAVEASWRLTSGNAWNVFALGVMAALIGLLGLLLLIVGIIPAIMWIKASFAALYLSMLEQNGEYAGLGEEP